MKKKKTFIFSNSADIKGLQSNADFIIRSWKAEHENEYAEFVSRIKDIGNGNLSILDELFEMLEDCITEDHDNDILSHIPLLTDASDVWNSMPQYLKTLFADFSEQITPSSNGVQKKGNILDIVSCVLEQISSSLTSVPSFLSSLKQKAVVENNSLIRCAYYFLRFDHGFIEMTKILNRILEDDIMGQEDLAMIHSVLSMMVPNSIESSSETKNSWEDAIENCNPEIWKDVSLELKKSNGNRGQRKQVRSIDDLLLGDKLELKRQIRQFIAENPSPICLAYLMEALVRSNKMKIGTKYIVFHRAIEQFTGCSFGPDSPQRRYGEIQELSLDYVHGASWKKARNLVMKWTNIFRAVA